MKKHLEHLKEELPFYKEFFLHGSRGKADFFFKEEVASSDWDYAVQHQQPWEQTHDHFLTKGWQVCVDKFYLDNDTAFVYEKLIGGEKVQISCRQNLQRYKDCWNSIDSTFYFKYLWKKSELCLPVEARRQYFNSLYYCWDRGGDVSF